MPITFITAFIRNFKPYELLCNLFIKVITFLSNIKFSVIDVPSFGSIEVLLYYIAIYILFSMKKFIYILIILFFILLKGKITTLDLINTLGINNRKFDDDANNEFIIIKSKCQKS